MIRVELLLLLKSKLLLDGLLTKIGDMGLPLLQLLTLAIDEDDEDDDDDDDELKLTISRWWLLLPAKSHDE